MRPFPTPTYVAVSAEKLASRENALYDGYARPFFPEYNVTQDPYLRASGGVLHANGLWCFTILTIPRLTAKEIVERISRGEWTASEVLEAYISRAFLAQNVTNCLTEGCSCRLTLGQRD